MRFIRILFVGILAVSPSATGAAPQDSDDKAVALAPVDVTMTLDIAGTGSGTVTSSPSGLATCTGAAQTCVGTFALGTVVTLTATAATGHEFTGWGGPCKGTAPCTVMMADARYVAAHFRLIPAVGTSFYHLDTLGSVRAVTNAVGDVIRRDDYHAFGEAGTPPVGDPIRFTGKERDAETALDYFGARYYRNLTGRFTTVDPGHVGGNTVDPQSWNAYAYARNNPLRFEDPTGTDYRIKIRGGPSWRLGDSEFKDLQNDPGEGFFVTPTKVYERGQSIGEVTYVNEVFERFTSDIAARSEAGIRAGLYGMGVGAAFNAGQFGFGLWRAGRFLFDTPVTGKIAGQMAKRGWSERLINDAIASGKRFPAVNKATGNPATRYVHPGTGQSVVVDNVTKQVIHVGGPGFRY